MFIQIHVEGKVPFLTFFRYKCVDMRRGVEKLLSLTLGTEYSILMNVLVFARFQFLCIKCVKV